jgi:hypothetical protein
MSFYVVNSGPAQNSSSILVGLRHGGMALGHFDGWLKMTILRGRFRSDHLLSKGSDGLDTAQEWRLPGLVRGCAEALLLS